MIELGLSALIGQIYAPSLKMGSLNNRSDPQINFYGCPILDQPIWSTSR
jgi:hypothetical protein